MGNVILVLFLVTAVGIPVTAFWVALLGFSWALWSVSGPVPPSKRKPKKSTPPLPPRRQQ